MRAAAVALLALTLLLQQTFLAFANVQDRRALRDRATAQTEVLARVDQVRNQLQSILLQTKALADRGNANAQEMLDQLRAQGIEVRTGTAVDPEGDGGP